jgi:hypothetical protein
MKQQRREVKGFRNRKMMRSSQDWSCNLLRPPPQNYESISAKQEIDEKLNKEKFECMICYEIVGRSAPIWSCGNCYAIFHLHCVRKWARAPSSVDLSAGQSQGSNWRYPGCQSVQFALERGVPAVVSVIGLLASGDFRKDEAHSFRSGMVSYYMTIV